ncbi:MAG: histidine kinase dimerization/phosphoacceptor domain -containing protein [Spirochaetota bacterium]
MEAKKSIRILFVEDSPEDAAIAERELRASGLDFESRRVDTKEAFLSSFGDFEPTILISAYSLAQFDAMKALRLTREHEPIRPFIVLTDSRNEETAVQCIKAGASDYVVKSHIGRLPFAVNEALEATRVASRKDAENRETVESLGRALREKDALLRELFHRTRNNMQVIIALLSFEAEVADDPRVSEVVKKASDRIMSMALAHKKLYESRDLSKIDISEYATELVDLAIEEDSSSANRIGVTTDMESISVSIDSAMPFGLVIHELVSNTLRHAFPFGREGRIWLRVARGSGREIEVEVSDDGVGIPDHYDFQRRDRLGLRLVKGLVEEQMRGRISFSTGPGLSCKISFLEAKPMLRF